MGIILMNPLLLLGSFAARPIAAERATGLVPAPAADLHASIAPGLARRVL